MSTGHRWAAKFGQLFVGDTGDREAVRNVVREFGIQDAIHFAAKAYVGESVRDPGKYFRENVANTIHLLDTLIETGVTRVIFSSSCATYGTPETLPITESEPQKPLNPYGESKLFVEKMLKWYGNAHDLKWVALRYFNAAGADPDGKLGEDHDPETHLIPCAIEAALGQRPHLDVFGTDYPTPDGTAIRDYTHVTDLGRAHVLGLDYLRRGGESIALNLGTGAGNSVMEVVNAVAAACARDVPLRLQPRREGDPAELVSDPALAKAVLGWVPEFRDLNRIVGTAAAWHQRTALVGQ